MFAPLKINWTASGLQRTTQQDTRDCCVYVFTETWLSDWVLDVAIQQDGPALHQADRDPTLCGKTRGGGLRVYINRDWCNNSVLVSKSCSSLVEYAIVRCRPLYLPKELSSLSIVAVYIPPSANAREALATLYRAILKTNTQKDWLLSPEISTMQISKLCFLNSINMWILQREGRTCWTLFTPPYPVHTGPSPDPTVDTQTPAHRPLVRRSRPANKQVKTRPEGDISAIQDCFECTNWQMFWEAALLRVRDIAFRAGDKEALSTMRATMVRAIRDAKRVHAQKMKQKTMWWWGRTPPKIKCYVWPRLRWERLCKESTHIRLLTQTTFPGVCSKDVQTNWQMVTQTSLTSPWAAAPSHHALKPPPLSLCPKSHLCPASLTTTPSHSPLPSWSALRDWSWGT